MERIKAIDLEAELPPKIKEEVEQLYLMAGVNPVIDYIDSLLKQVDKNPLGNQFSPDRSVNEIYQTTAKSGAFMGKSKDEVTQKKISLEVQGIHVREEFMRTISGLRDFLVHVRMSQANFNPTGKEKS